MRAGLRLRLKHSRHVTRWPLGHSLDVRSGPRARHTVQDNHTLPPAKGQPVPSHHAHDAGRPEEMSNGRSQAAGWNQEVEMITYGASDYPLGRWRCRVARAGGCARDAGAAERRAGRETCTQCLNENSIRARAQTQTYGERNASCCQNVRLGITAAVVLIRHYDSSDVASRVLASRVLTPTMAAHRT